MAEAVNVLLPPEERFSKRGWRFRKYGRLHLVYRRLYPSGSLLRRQAAFAMAANGCVLVVMALLGFGWQLALCYAGLNGLLFGRPLAARSPPS